MWNNALTSADAMYRIVGEVEYLIHAEVVMDFKQIEAFVNVVRYKSFSKAADATFFTQPTISTHISALEKELGTKLFNRKGRTVDMTAQGKKFYKYAIEMVNIRANAIEELRGDDDYIDGVLELQTSSIPGIVLLPEMISGFRRENKNVKFYVDMSDSQDVADNIISRRGEIGFIGEKISSASIDCTRLFTDKVVMVVPKSYGVTSKSISLSKAVKYPFIWREAGSATRKSFEAEAEKLGFDKSEFDVVAKCNDINAIIRSIELGLGVSIMSERTVERFGREQIKVLNIEGFHEKRSFYMIRARGISHSPVANAFTQYVKDNCNKAL